MTRGLEDRDHYCPECNGWLEHIDGDRWSCDTCEYSVDFSIDGEIAEGN